MGELEVIRLFKRLWRPKRSILEKYDDAWAFRIGRTFVTWSTDMLVESTDVPPSMTYELAARKAVVMTSSDIGSKGHRPRYHLMSLGLKSSTVMNELRGILAGVRSGIAECGGELVGGDTNEAKELTLSMTAVGLSKTKPIPRIIGREGDLIATTGKFGGPPAGLLMLLGKIPRTSAKFDEMVDSVLRPRAHVKAGVSLAEAGVLSGSTDSSDGLSASLHNMIMNSRRGVILERVPYVNRLEEFAQESGLDPLDLALNAGEEYNLVLSIRKDMWKRAVRIAEDEKFELYEIGRAVSPKGLWILDERGKRRAIARGGWQHFKRRNIR